MLPWSCLGLCGAVLLGRETKATASSDRLWGSGQGRHHPPHSQASQPQLFPHSMRRASRFRGGCRFQKTDDWPVMICQVACFVPGTAQPRNDTTAQCTRPCHGVPFGIGNVSHFPQGRCLLRFGCGPYLDPPPWIPLCVQNPRLRSHGSRHQTRNLEIRGSRPPRALRTRPEMASFGICGWAQLWATTTTATAATARQAGRDEKRRRALLFPMQESQPDREIRLAWCAP